MRLGPVAAWRPRGGRLLRLRPTADLRVLAAHAPVVPGPVSFLQADHLESYAARQRVGSPHYGWTGVAATLPVPLDASAWARAVAGFVADHEVHRTFFSFGTDAEGGRAERRIVPADAFRGDPFVLEPLDLMHNEAEQDLLHDRLEALLGPASTPEGWPGFAMVVIDHGDGFSFMWTCDHAATDAASQILLASEVASRYEAGSDDPGTGPRPGPSFVDYAEEERRRAASYGAASPEVTRWREIVGDHGGSLPAFPLDLGLAPGDTAPVRILEREIVAHEQVQALEEEARRCGARMPSAIVAACAVAERQLAGRDRYFGVTVLGTRDAHSAEAQGWYCNFAPLSIAVEDGDPPAVVLARAEASFAEARRLNEMPVHAALGHLIAEGSLDPTSVASPQFMSYLDLRRFPGASASGLAGAAFESGHHFTAEGRTRNASSWFNRDQDRLYVACQVPDTPLALAAAERYYGRVADLLVALGGGERDAAVLWSEG